MAWVTPPTFTVGELLTASLMNQITGDLAFLHGDVGGVTYTTMANSGGTQMYALRFYQASNAADVHVEWGGATSVGSVSNSGTGTVNITYASAGSSSSLPVAGGAIQTYGYVAFAVAYATSGFTLGCGNLSGGSTTLYASWHATIT